jgi:hypothetical protein
MGRVAPSPALVTLTPSDVELVRMVAERRNRYRGYTYRPDAWGRGFVTNPALHGLLGELAACAFINKRLGTRLSIDSEDMRNGDGGVDIRVRGVSVDVKTRVTGHRCLVRRFDEHKRLMPLTADVYLFAQMESARRIWLLGWMSSADMVSLARFEKSSRADHWNLDISESDLEMPSHLIRHIALQEAA